MPFKYSELSGRLDIKNGEGFRFLLQLVPPMLWLADGSIDAAQHNELMEKLRLNPQNTLGGYVRRNADIIFINSPTLADISPPTDEQLKEVEHNGEIILVNL